MISFFGKDFSDTGISIEGNSFLKYLKYEVFSFFGKDFPNIIEETHRNERKGFSLQKGRRVFFMQKTTEAQKILKKEKGKKDNFSAKKTDRQTY